MLMRSQAERDRVMPRYDGIANWNRREGESRQISVLFRDSEVDGSGSQSHINPNGFGIQLGGLPTGGVFRSARDTFVAIYFETAFFSTQM
jgi:hypothetical protein